MIMQSSDKSQAIRALRNAAPYIRLFKGKTFVIKAGGAVFGDADATSALIEQIAILHTLGIRVVMVHGGGPQLTQVTEAMGVPTKMVQGRRVTDEKSLDATSMVLNGLINTKLLTICREHEIDAVGVSGVDAGLITAHKRGPVKVEGEMVDYGFVGDIDLVDESVLKKLLDSGLMPVVSPLSADDKGQLLNINADTIAAEIAAQLKAEKLILLSDVDGIYVRAGEPETKLSRLTAAEAEAMINDGTATGGMIPKLRGALEALQAGVETVEIGATRVIGGEHAVCELQAS
jgi:acetylglutamate kinase